MDGSERPTAGALDVAAAIIRLRPGIDQMQLHKLLYLVQAASLVWFDVPAFDDQRIEAWKKGPVTRQVAGVYKAYSWQSIMEPAGGDATRVSGRTAWTVERVVGEYGEISGPALADLVKGPGSPWRQARGDIPDSENSQAEITLAMIAEYHETHGIVPPEALSSDERQLAQAFLEGDEHAFANLLQLAAKNRS